MSEDALRCAVSVARVAEPQSLARYSSGIHLGNELAAPTKAFCLRFWPWDRTGEMEIAALVRLSLYSGGQWNSHLRIEQGSRLLLSFSKVVAWLSP